MSRVGCSGNKGLLDGKCSVVFFWLGKHREGLDSSVSRGDMSELSWTESQSKSEP